MVKNNSSFSIIVPAYNESQKIGETISEILKVFMKLEHPFEIIIVNDGSTDNTCQIIDDLALEKPEVKAVHLPLNQGKGYAISKGLEASTGEYVVFMDADLDIHPAQIENIIDRLKKEECDVAIGSKRHPDSTFSYPLSRKFISTVYYLFVRTLFGLHVKDTQAGLKIYKRNVLKDILPRIIVKMFAFDLEMLVATHKLGYHIKEFPIHVTFSRKYGRITFSDCWNTGIDTLAIFYRYLILNFYSRPVPDNPKEPEVSIIIAMKEADAFFTKALAACLNQDYTNYEVIILPDKDISDLLLEFMDKDKVRIIPTGPVNPAYKINVGAEHATGEILAFIDDRSFPKYDWLSTAVKHFGDQAIAAVGGPSITPADSPLMERITGHVASSLIISGKNRIHHLPHRYQEVNTYPSCNLFLLRRLFMEAGGYSPIQWPCEDRELCGNIRERHGKKIIYDPHLFLEHRSIPISRSYFSGACTNAIRRGHLARLWPEKFLSTGDVLISLMCLLLAAGAISVFIPGFQWMGITIWGLYLLTALFFSLTLSDLLETILTAVMTIATHFTSGIFFQLGLVKTKIRTDKCAFSDLAGSSHVKTEDI